jgi:tripartite ATP-independent transporter DctP family solute receptor
MVRLLRRLLLLGALCATAAHAQMELKLGHIGEPGSVFTQSAEEFARKVELKLGGRVRIAVYGSSQLGGDNDLLRKLKTGGVDIAVVSTLVPANVELLNIFELPYLVKDRAHMARIEKEIFWPRLAPELEKKGYTILALWENGFRHVTNNRRAIKTPGQLNGIRMRVPDNKWRMKMFQAYGATAVPMKFAEVFSGLQLGLVDGQENPLTQIYSARFQEVQKFVSLTGHVYSPAYVVVAAKRWSTLSAEARRTLEELARETQGFVYETAAREDLELIGKLKAAGMQVNEVDKASFVAASKAVYDEFSKAVPGSKDVIEKALALAK